MAGDALRSSTRYHALDETALFGCGCRHEFPLMFFNLKHGERYTVCTSTLTNNSLLSADVLAWCFCRLSYAVWMVDRLLHNSKDEVHLAVMYDVACSLQKHLQVSSVYIFCLNDGL